ncbi:MAG: glycosyltransferase, partial [Candidatus Hydrogenedentes bacterium]|nr:glycosyltransferase [Candidatus Hydrogenedentota bacterium]
MAPLHVLTFNFHEPYLCLLAKTGYRFTVGLYERAPLARAWQVKFRPVPKNASLVEEAIWRRDLAAGKYDVVVAHNETNAADLFRYETPCLLVCHNRKSFLKTTLPNQDGDSLAKYEQLLERLQERFTFVFISESKRTDYGIPGEVIPPGIDLKEFHGYHGTIPEVLRVGNAMRARNRMFDVDFQEQVCAGIPNRVAGDDPAMPTASPSRSYEDLLDHYRSLRCLLHVTREDWEDGYNLAMLEAMACGMPVVALANRTSPLTDGVDGYTAYQPEILRERLRALLADRELAHRIGENGRETVARRFPIAPFVENWGRVLEEAASRSPGRKGGSGYHPHANLPRQRIVLDYVATPLTTARYFECALRKRHRVITAGFRCPEALFPEWGFPEPIPTYPAQQIDVPLNTTYEELMRRMPDSFAPDLYLWVDSGAKTISPDITRLKAPKISYLIDTHLAPELRLEIAHNFDFTFMAQKGQVAAFARAGIRNVAWLPLACSPELHAGKATNRIYDVAYVGRLSEDLSDRRRDLLRGVARRFPNHKIGQFWPEEMAGIYARSKIVVNAAVNRDLNMRVFEAMASG